MKQSPYARPAAEPEQPTQLFTGRAPQTLYFPAETNPPRRRSSLRWFAAATLLMWLLLVAFIVGGAAWFYSSTLLLPGVQIMGLELGGQSVTDTAVALETAWQQNSLVLEGPQQSWPTAPANLGLTLDAAATATKAHAASRSLAGLGQLAQTGRITIAPVVTLDTAVATTALQTIAPQVELPVQHAGVQLVNGQAVATPPIDGQTLNVAATVAYLQQYQDAVLAHGRLPLSYMVLPATAVDVAQLVAELNQLLGLTVQINAHDPIRNETVTWNLPPELWGSWVTIRVNPNNLADIDWQLDSTQAQAYLAAQATQLGDTRYLQTEELLRQVMAAIRAGETAVNTRIYHTPTQYTVQSGDSFAVIGQKVGIPYPWIQAANPGVAALSVGQTIALPSPDDLLPLPVIPHKRIIVSIANQTVQAWENGQLKWDWPASTGIASSPTAPGIFQIQTHFENAYAANWDLWMPNFMGIYRPAPQVDFMNGFHGFPTRDGQILLWTNNLGGPVTYGCILISNENARSLYEWAEEGVVVEIQP
jgi:lipoprotein-anchoring transpeptidase ErfK/SrfK